MRRWQPKHGCAASPQPSSGSVQFKSCLERELHAVEAQQADFEADFSAADFQEAVAGWTDKIQRAEAGEQLWGLFTARKPLDVE